MNPCIVEIFFFSEAVSHDHFRSQGAGISYFGFSLRVEEFRERVKGFGVRFEVLGLVVGKIFWRFWRVCVIRGSILGWIIFFGEGTIGRRVKDLWGRERSGKIEGGSWRLMPCWFFWKGICMLRWV